ncbi:MAG TPA: lysophospholipid acyltransferase family protein [Armatimonadota bacterium]|nr:lysophospholipid acyltransferase family protein [Armatimonadota bacterium]
MYYVSRAIFRLIFRILGGVTAVGVENTPETGGVILAPNHISYVDPPAVACPMSRQLHFMAKGELFRAPVLRTWMRMVGAFPVRRGTADRKALRRAIELLGEGRVVCIFPEGTRSPDGKLQDPELGIGLVALKSRAPVTPALMIGTDKVLPPHSKRLHFHPIKIIYGEPLTFPDLYEAGESRQALEEIGRRVMAAIAELSSKHAG